MENAAKALIIAGSILLTIILLTLFAYLFSHMAESSSSIYTIMDQSEIAKFNQQFLNYKGKEQLTYQDVATIINLARDAEESRSWKAVIEIKVDGTPISYNYDEWLNGHYTDGATYKCTDVNVNTSTLLVDRIEIES